MRKLSPNDAWVDEARVVVLPTLVEHAPRGLLRALTLGIPVVATAECGLGECDGVTTVHFGDSQACIEALQVFF